jgi:tRNA(fMet)-specific endonuclease VapC
VYLFDTDHITILQLSVGPAFGRLLQRMRGYADTVFYLSIVSMHEQTVGAHTYVAKARKRSAVLRGYEMFERIRTRYSIPAQVLLFDQAAADVFADVFDVLRAQKVRIGTMDLRIAAIALTNNLTVLTRNLRDFTQVPGLTVEDWTT